MEEIVGKDPDDIEVHVPPWDPDGRRRRATERRNLRRDQILAAACQVFSVKGYHQSSISDILQEAGAARGTFYLYFASKRAIFDELIDQLLSQLTTAVRRIKVGPSEEPPLEQLRGNVRRVIDVLERNKHLTIILLREAVGVDSDFDQKLFAFYDQLAKLIEGAISLGQTMGLLRECDPAIIASCILGSVKEVMVRRLCGGGELASHPQEKLVGEFVEYSLQGIFRR